MLGFASIFASILIMTEVPTSPPVIISETECKRISDIPQTKPKVAKIPELLKDLSELKDIQGRKVFASIKPEFVQHLKELFERDPAKISKLEQFYGLLYWIGFYKDLPERRIDFDQTAVRKVLFSSETFSTPDVPSSLKAVTLFWSKAFSRATFLVEFDKEKLILPLNAGNGFATYREGLCQIAQALVFYGNFEFTVYPRGNGNFYVSDFKNVDLFGQFGARGIVNVDIQYVSVKSVEFLKGSPMGVVKAKVSRKEFEINKHSVLLRMVTNFVTDKSTQPIDW